MHPKWKIVGLCILYINAAAENAVIFSALTHTHTHTQNRFDVEKSRSWKKKTRHNFPHTEIPRQRQTKKLYMLISWNFSLLRCRGLCVYCIFSIRGFLRVYLSFYAIYFGKAAPQERFYVWLSIHVNIRCSSLNFIVHFSFVFPLTASEWCTATTTTTQ